MITATKEQEIIESLKDSEFNDKQIAFILERIKEYDEIRKFESFDIDNYERDMWYTINQSGLFEKDDDENLTDIDTWSPEDTRSYITDFIKQ